jgi:hypothetical protein
VLEKYYNVLGVTSHSSLNEVKKAFRIKAKELHPDVNRSTNAHEQFILLLQAYEYIVNLRTGKIFQNNTTSTKHYKSYQRWQDNEAERARHRAEYYSRKRYDVFEDSEYYKNLTHLNTILDHIQFFFSLAMVIVLPVYLTYTYGSTGFWISLIAVFVTLPVSIDSLKSGPRIDLKEFFLSSWKLIQTGIGYGTVISVLNIYLLLRFGFQTMMPFDMLLMLYSGFIAFGYVIFRLIRNESNRSALFFSLVFIPFVLNNFFLVNYIFSKNPESESYSFVHETGRGRSGTQELSYIKLENNAYDEFNGIRVFADFEAMRRKRRITYTFEDGCLGLRVMKKYKFE